MKQFIYPSCSTHKKQNRSRGLQKKPNRKHDEKGGFWSNDLRELDNLSHGGAPIIRSLNKAQLEYLQNQNDFPPLLIEPYIISIPTKVIHSIKLQPEYRPEIIARLFQAASDGKPALTTKKLKKSDKKILQHYGIKPRTVKYKISLQF